MSDKQPQSRPVAAAPAAAAVPVAPVEPRIPPLLGDIGPKEPISDEEIAALASRGLLFPTMAENVHAHAQALARLAGKAEADAEVAAKRIADAAAASLSRSKPG